MIFGFGIRPVTLEPTLLKINYPLYSDGPWDCRIIYAWAIEVEGGFVSSCSLLFTILHRASHYLKFLRFNADVHAFSTPNAYNRCGTLKGSIQGNKSGSHGHGWKQPDCANCFWHAAIALVVHNEFPLSFHA
nr:hypothetical protein [Tanacetum cinerariifolium]